MWWRNEQRCQLHGPTINTHHLRSSVREYVPEAVIQVLVHGRASRRRTMPGLPALHAADHCSGSRRTLRCSTSILPSVARRTATLLTASIWSRQSAAEKTARALSLGQQVLSAPRAVHSSMMLSEILRAVDATSRLVLCGSCSASTLAGRFVMVLRLL